ncbi:ABC transporter permease [Puia dinghuensis]|uniref:ABC transporter permease n=1 Tax=Puia dinghuensis TaxID=1792502 RepID=A0A8J2UH17_9BACT|nr:ABC transporter permease [Puia dinghuensis]GGB15903.1 ABC transporter permease [Puia dinghuensis]
MLKNYLKIAFRNLTKYKFISFINLFGLTIGITCCLLILTYIVHEESYDRYNTKADRIWRVTRSFNNKEGIVSLHLGAVAPPFAPYLQNDFPDIQKITRILPNGTSAFHYEDKIFNEKDINFADNNLFSVFDVPLIKGDRTTALEQPFTMVMTEAIAKKYFGDADPINKVVRLDNQYNFRVSAIMAPLPENSHFHADILLSFNTLKDSAIYGEKGLMTNWGNNAFYTYLLFPENYPAKTLEERFPAFLDRHMAGDDGYGKGSKPSTLTRLYLQQLTDIHLHSHLDEELEQNGDSGRVTIFGAIALFILLIACINYMNLSTARSTLRAREIGIRKVSGAQRGEIITQFLTESVLISFVATLLAVVLTILTLPSINDLTGLHLSAHILQQPTIIALLVVTPIVVGILSGLYPALFLSSFQPVKVLKGLFKAGSNTVNFRKVLVVLQFAISIVLLISTAIVFQQLHYMQNAALGFDKEHILTMGYPNGLYKNYESFRTTLLQDPHVLQVTRSSRIPTGRLLDEQGASTESGDSLRPVTADIKYVAVDHDFLKTYGIPVVAGRDYSRDYSTDSTGFLLNVAATKVLGVKTPQEMVGRHFSYGGVKGRVVGIMRDFNFESMHQAILPIIFIIPSAAQAANNYGNISIKLAGSDIKASVAYVEKTWKRFLPETPFEYTFLDDRFDKLYKSEQQQGSLFTTFAGIAIFIACLGLLGLSAFSISQRIKEIGVRKVLGASTGSIVTLLSTDFLRLVAIASLIAFPIAWYAMHNWLRDFAYRISIEWWVFLGAGILAAAVALVTISIQAIKAAVANPVKALRSE